MAAPHNHTATRHRGDSFLRALADLEEQNVAVEQGGVLRGEVGLGRVPSRAFGINQSWLALTTIAADLVAWT